MLSCSGLLLVWAALSAAFLVLLITQVLGSSATVVLDDYASMIAPAVGGWACLRRRRGVAQGQARAWGLLGVSLLCWAAGGVAWTVDEVHLGREVPFPSLADIGYLLSVPLAVAALLCSPRRSPGWRRPPATGTGRRRIRGRRRCSSSAWALVLGPAFHTNTGSLLSQAISLAYPASDVLIATMALLMLSRARGEQRTTMLLVACGVLLVAVADSSFTWFTAGAPTSRGTCSTAATSRATCSSASPRYARPPGPRMCVPDVVEELAAPSGLAMTLPYLPLLISIPVSIAVEASGHPLGPFQFYVALVMVAALLLRQLLNLQVDPRVERQAVRDRRRAAAAGGRAASPGVPRPADRAGESSALPLPAGCTRSPFARTVVAIR